MPVLEDIKQAVIDGNAPKMKAITERALAEGISINDIINEGLIGGMSYIGVKFKNNEVYVPEVLIAARAMHAGMGVIKPLLTGENFQSKGTFVIGTVKGDLHDIGKNLVIMMMEGAGFKVVDLGIDVPTEKFIQAIEEHKPQIVGLSALLTTTMVQMKNTIQELKPYRNEIKVMIGGAPVTQKFADEIGADAYAPDAATAVELATDLLAS
ncbi:MAG: corrinoid protein [Syntrophomonadaceae bacterium]|nr:corrinoid protein [Syntrophomonadaceae bacterium]